MVIKNNASFNASTDLQSTVKIAFPTLMKSKDRVSDDEDKTPRNYAFSTQNNAQ